MENKNEMIKPDNCADTTDDRAKVSDKKSKKSGKVVLMIVLSAIVALLLVIAGIFIIPKLLVNVDSLCAAGEYKKAYDLAEEEKKIYVQAESAAAKSVSYIADNLFDNGRFELLEAYFDPSQKNNIGYNGMVILVATGKGNNSNPSPYYCCFDWDDSRKSFVYLGSTNSLIKEKCNPEDSRDVKLAIATDNVIRAMYNLFLTQATIRDKYGFSSTISLDENSLNRINNLFSKGDYKKIELIPLENKN